MTTHINVLYASIYKTMINVNTYARYDKRYLHLTTVELNYVQLLQDLESKTKRRYKYTEIALISGLSRQTVTKLFTGKAQAIDLDTIGKLLDFFASEGMPITLNDLFTVTTERLN